MPKGPRGEKRPAMAAGIVDSLWTMEDIAVRIGAGRPQAGSAALQKADGSGLGRSLRRP